MKALVIGLGSMGKRRIRLMKKIDGNLELIGVDLREDRKQEAEKLYQIKTFSNLDEALNEACTCAFICTSPLSHAKLISICLKHNLHVFSELNLVSDLYDENIEMAKQKGLVLFISSTFLYRDEITYIRNQVKQSQSILTYTYHVGQYLPDWHPWESYTDYFIGDAKTNGCREIMAIDLPWIYKTFGKIKTIEVRRSKKTSLNIEYADCYLILLEHENGTQGTFMVDVVSRKAVRNFEVYGEDLYLSWDGTEHGLFQYDIDAKKDVSIDLYGDYVDRQEGYADFVIENEYLNEIEAFYKMILTEGDTEYTFREDKEILELIDRIEGKL